MMNPFLRKQSLVSDGPTLSDSRGFTSPLISSCPKNKYSRDNSLFYRYNKQKLPDEIVERMMLQLYSFCEEGETKDKNEDCQQSLISPRKKSEEFSSDKQNYQKKLKKAKEEDKKMRRSMLENIFNLSGSKYRAYRELRKKIQEVAEEKNNPPLKYSSIFTSGKKSNLSFHSYPSEIQFDHKKYQFIQLEQL